MGVKASYQGWDSVGSPPSVWSHVPSSGCYNLHEIRSCFVKSWESKPLIISDAVQWKISIFMKATFPHPGRSGLGPLRSKLVHWRTPYSDDGERTGDEFLHSVPLLSSFVGIGSSAGASPILSSHLLWIYCYIRVNTL